MEDLASLAVEVEEERATAVARSSSFHGPRHWRNVARIALELDARHDAEADLKVVFLFAALHDACRENDDDDPRHGTRAAELALDLWAEGTLVVTQPQLTVLRDALRWHNGGRTDTRGTVAVCWDADRLTLTRVGKVPSMDYMSVVLDKNHFISDLDYATRIQMGGDLPWAVIWELYEERIEATHAAL